MTSIITQLRSYDCRTIATFAFQRKLTESLIFITNDKVVEFLSKITNTSIDELLKLPIFQDILMNNFGTIVGDKMICLNDNEFVFNGNYLDNDPTVKVTKILQTNGETNNNVIYFISGLLATPKQRDELIMVTKSTQKPYDDSPNKLDKNALTLMLRKQTPKDILNFCNVNNHIRRLCHTEDVGKYLLDSFYPELVYTNNPFEQFTAATNIVETHYHILYYIKYNDPPRPQLEILDKPRIFAKPMIVDKIPGWSKAKLKAKEILPDENGPEFDENGFDLYENGLDLYNKGVRTKGLLDIGKPDKYKDHTIGKQQSKLITTFNILGNPIPSGYKAWILTIIDDSIKVNNSIKVDDIKVFKSKEQAISYYIKTHYIKELEDILINEFAYGDVYFGNNDDIDSNSELGKLLVEFYGVYEAQNKVFEENDEVVQKILHNAEAIKYLEDLEYATPLYTKDAIFEFLMTHEYFYPSDLEDGYFVEIKLIEF